MHAPYLRPQIQPIFLILYYCPRYLGHLVYKVKHNILDKLFYVSS